MRGDSALYFLFTWQLAAGNPKLEIDNPGTSHDGKCRVRSGNTYAVFQWSGGQDAVLLNEGGRKVEEEGPMLKEAITLTELRCDGSPGHDSIQRTMPLTKYGTVAIGDPYPTVDEASGRLKASIPTVNVVLGMYNSGTTPYELCGTALRRTAESLTKKARMTNEDFLTKLCSNRRMKEIRRKEQKDDRKRLLDHAAA